MTPKLSGHLSNQIFRAIDDKKLTAMELIYFSKAFDTICHSSLLQTLHNLHVGRSSQALKWFESYLTGRGSLYGSVPHYRVTSQLTYGVPQGSILGPALFSLCTCMNDLPNAVQFSSVESYVDDTKIFMSFSS